MGEKQLEEPNQFLSLFIETSCGIGFVALVFGLKG
jgi:hypothetical protein